MALDAVGPLVAGRLGAEYATSEAFADNAASYAVSEKLGYADDGVQRHVIRGAPVVGRRLRLDRQRWAAARTVPVQVDGLTPCLPMFLGVLAHVDAGETSPTGLA